MVPPGKLRRLFRPRRIAVVGGLAARRVAEQCDRLGFDGEVWPVHPQRKVVEGRRAFASLDDLPGVPDAAFVGVNRHATVDAVAKLADIGAGGAVCYASGFREAGDGEALEERLLEAAGDMPIVGPNCYGLVNFLDGAPLWPDQHGGRRLGANARGVAIVTQSSNIAISMTMQRRGLPLAYIATAGNQAQLGVSALASALLDDDRVSALGLHIEGFDSIAQLEALAHEARRKRTPIVALKTGRSTLAQAAALSHTASIAGSDVGADALLRRLGIARATDLAEFLETLKLLHVHGALGGARLGAMCCSGGEASLLADAAQDAGVALPPLAPYHISAVSAAVHELVAVANPLDYHTFAWGDADALCDTFSAFANAPLDAEETEARGRTPFDALMLVLDFPRGDRCDDTEWHTTLAAFERTADATSAKGVVAATLGENLPEAYAEQMMARRMAPLGGLREALAAIAHAAAIGRAWQAPAPEPTLRCEQAQTPPVLLDEAEAKALLAGYGVCVPAGGVAHCVEDALAIVETLGGRVAAKALGIAHKSERGAVRLDLRGREQIAAAAEQLLLLGDGLLVERHHNASVCELIVGARREPTLGMMLTIGSGGTLVELLRDTATLLLPTTEAAVRQALAGLRCWPLLQGYRGRPKADVDAAVKAILAIACFAKDNHATLDELDVNPLAVGPEGQGAVALDALLRILESRASNRQPRRNAR